MTAMPIPLDTWPRRNLLALFRQCQKPQYSVTARIEVTKILIRRADDSAFSTYLACIHAIGAALHAVPELGQRIRGDKVVQHDQLILTPTLQFPDKQLGFSYLNWQADAEAFATAARQCIAVTLAEEPIQAVTDGDDGVAFLSCQPWLDFTAFDSPVLNSDDSIPRICWGRYTPDGTGRWTMAVALQVHHGLVDGLHVAQFFRELQEAADQF